MGHVQEALNLFEKIQLEGIRPDAITYSTLICSFCKADMLDNAYALLCRGVSNGFIPNDVTWYFLTRYSVMKKYEEISIVHRLELTWRRLGI